MDHFLIWLFGLILVFFLISQEVDLNWLGQNWEENATDEDFEDDEKCLDYLHGFKLSRCCSKYYSFQIKCFLARERGARGLSLPHKDKKVP